MRGYTPEQLELFTRLAHARRGRDAVLQAQLVSVGAVTGLTGSPEPMRALERAVLGSASTAATATGGDIQQRLKGFARRLGARKQQGGPDGALGR